MLQGKGFVVAEGLVLMCIEFVKFVVLLGGVVMPVCVLYAFSTVIIVLVLTRLVWCFFFLFHFLLPPIISK